MNRDVQYGAAVASVYDALISPAAPTEQTVERLRPYVAGARVLDVGVGTGRVALPVASLAAYVVGVDNSHAMLEEFRRKGVPDNIMLVEADFRLPLPVAGGFASAYALLGSLACVRSQDELTLAFTHIRNVLVPGGTLSFEYYAAPTYRWLAEQGTLTIPTPHLDGHATFTVTLADTGLLTMGSRIETPNAPMVAFSEDILLLDRSQVEACAAQAGFTIECTHPASVGDAYDWYTARAPKNQRTQTC